MSLVSGSEEGGLLLQKEPLLQEEEGEYFHKDVHSKNTLSDRKYEPRKGVFSSSLKIMPMMLFFFMVIGIIAALFVSQHDNDTKTTNKTADTWKTGSLLATSTRTKTSKNKSLPYTIPGFTLLESLLPKAFTEKKISIKNYLGLDIVDPTEEYLRLYEDIPAYQNAVRLMLISRRDEIMEQLIEAEYRKDAKVIGFGEEEGVDDDEDEDENQEYDNADGVLSNYYKMNYCLDKLRDLPDLQHDDDDNNNNEKSSWKMFGRIRGDYDDDDAPAYDDKSSRHYQQELFLAQCMEDLHVIDPQQDAFLVETLPIGDFDLPEIPGVLSTYQGLMDLINNAKFTLDMSVMYWALDASALPSATTYFTPEELKELGSDFGKDIYQAIFDAAQRGVQIRVFQDNSTAKAYPEELMALLDEYPNNVHINMWNAANYYDGGIMHMKLIIADHHSFYLGSANMDWLSLAQVKEMGILVLHNSLVTQDLLNYYNIWWYWGKDNTCPGENIGNWSRNIFSEKIQQYIHVPCWSDEVYIDDLICHNPLENHRPYMLMPPSTMQHEFTTKLSMSSPLASQFYITGSPKEVISIYNNSKGTPPDRTEDYMGLVQTIRSARKTVDISVMDFLPSNLYSRPPVTMDGVTSPGPTIWWSDIYDALLTVLTNKLDVKVRLLVSLWSNTSPRSLPYLESLQFAASACRIFDNTTDTYACSGRLEIRIFEVPDWNMTAPPPDANGTYPDPEDVPRDSYKYPSFSRVNHAKYIVTDKRFNVGTSNLAWEYFYSTAGASFNSNDEALRTQLQSVFERDWNSNYVYTIQGEHINTSLEDPDQKVKNDEL